ncbi:MAG TPA: surface carbohydrate biosynthesis protein [Gemmatimonadaceae bacterium]|nr:surface carbohydrate biosynthesis protein [Gemmatimonadaceae bacterium]
MRRSPRTHPTEGAMLAPRSARTHRPRRILLGVPVKTRDLDGHALVAYHLTRRYGHEVLVQTLPDTEVAVLEHACDAIVLDYLGWEPRAQQARLAKAIGMKVIVLPTAGLYEKREDHARSAGKDTGAGSSIDCYLTWGDDARDAVLAYGVLPPERIHSAGCPRFDLYHESYRSLLQPRADFLRRHGIDDPGAPVVLWATSTNHFMRNHRTLERAGRALGRIPAAETRAQIEDERTQFTEHSRLVLALATRHPEWSIIIKVHPLEWINPYLSLPEQAPNIHLAFNAPIRDFLAHCDVLLQRGCTTATEAWMLGKPVLELAMGRYHGATPVEHVRGNHVVTSLEETEEAIGCYLAGMPVSAERQRARDAYLTHMYNGIDGRASERCAALIDRVLSPPAYSDADQASVRAAARAALAHWKRAEDARIVNRFKDAFGISRRRSLRFWRPWLRREARPNAGRFSAKPAITPDDVSELYQRYDRIHITARAAGRCSDTVTAQHGSGEQA